eukprot:6153996-Amphidinium_carterae.1
MDCNSAFVSVCWMNFVASFSSALALSRTSLPAGLVETTVVTVHVSKYIRIAVSNFTVVLSLLFPRESTVRGRIAYIRVMMNKAILFMGLAYFACAAGVELPVFIGSDA